jgi:hypothetical protein
VLWHKALDGSGPTLLYVSLRSTRAVRRVGAPIEGQGVFRPALYMLYSAAPRSHGGDQAAVGTSEDRAFYGFYGFLT